MASKNTLNVASGDVLIINELSKYLKYTATERKFLVRLAKKGIVAVETLLEEAISKVSGIARSNKDGEDLVNGWDAKKGVVSDHHHGENGPGMNRECTIGNIKNKNDHLIIMIADGKSNEVFFFKVPPHDFVGRTALTVTFNTSGGELTKFRKINGAVENSFSWRMWNMHRVDSFSELCAS